MNAERLLSCDCLSHFAPLVIGALACCLSLVGCSSSNGSDHDAEGTGAPAVTVTDSRPVTDNNTATVENDNKAAVENDTNNDTAAETNTVADLGDSQPVDQSNDDTGTSADDNSEVGDARKPPDELASNTASAAVAKPGGIQVLIKNKEFQVEGPDDALRVSYDDLDLLKVINMEPVTPDAQKYMPDWLKSLDGKRIRIRGFMYPPFEQTGLTWFDMARDTQICCFGRDPKVYDVFRVILQEGVTTDYIELKPFDVVGVFHIDPVELGDELARIYYIDDAVIVKK